MNELIKFEEQGFFIMRNIIKGILLDDIKKYVVSMISSFAGSLNTSFANYTYCTGRWLINDCTSKAQIYEEIDEILRNKLEFIFKRKLEIKKKNLICKNQHILDAVPLHQDISYSHNSPYHFTTWLALNRIVEGSGELRLVRSSHKWSVEPAVDFWDPYFFDYKREQYPHLILSIPLEEGDIVVFDSRIWHGSNKNYLQRDRYSYTIRWVMNNKPFVRIPQPAFSEFGMWNCFEKTKSLLSNSLKRTETHEDLDFLSLIYDQQQQIKGIKNANFDADLATRDLENLKILHQGANLHNAGDLCGKIYKNLWFSLLQYI